ncbi:MAG TPA: hypothetical protein PLF13_10785 [candidate division Zixibacteria bacterium]|nr:hypothetical protein [candidate division Zixibacteria bacterium]
MKYLSVVIIVALAFLAGLMTGCSSDEPKETRQEPSTQNQQPLTADSGHVYYPNDDGVIEIPYEMSGEPFDLRGKPVEIAGAVYPTASQWKDLGPTDKYAARYSFGPLQGEKDPAMLVIYRPEKDITVDRQRLHWIYCMSFADSRDPRTAALVHDREPDGMKTHVLSIMGDYTPSGTSDTLRNYRFVGVVLEAPEGKVNFELAGPDYTARIMIEAFMNAIYQLRKAS